MTQYFKKITPKKIGNTMIRWCVVQKSCTKGWCRRFLRCERTTMVIN